MTKETFLIPPLAINSITKKEIPVALFGMKTPDKTEKILVKERKINLVVVCLFFFVISSIFQTLAWYHNIDGKKAFWSAFFLTGGFIILEYIFLIPANNIGYKLFDLIQLGMIVEVVNWSVFILYVYFVRGEPIERKSWIGLAVMMVGVFIAYT